VITVDLKKLGLICICYGLLFLIIGGIEAIMMRIQLAVSYGQFVSPQMFNRMFTMTTWMHIFWKFGHPEVYRFVIPAFAVGSEIARVFSRKAIFGYQVMVAATVSIGFVGMSVWAYHMFKVDIASYSNAFFVLTTMAVGAPIGIKIFNWMGTMRRCKIRYAVPMLFCLGFLLQFLVAGLAGTMLAAAPFNWQLSGSYFVVAHFHNMIVDKPPSIRSAKLPSRQLTRCLWLVEAACL